MKKVIIRLEGAFNTTTNNKLSIDYFKVFEQFKSEGWGYIFYSGKDQSGTVRNTPAGINTFYLPETIQTSGAQTVSIRVDKQKEVRVSYDIATLSQEGADIHWKEGNLILSEAWVSKLQEKLLQTKLLYLQVKAASGIINFLKNTSGKIITVNVRKKEAADVLPDIDEARNKIWETIFGKQLEFKFKPPTRSAIGTGQLILMISPQMKNYLVQVPKLFPESTHKSLLKASSKEIVKVGDMLVKVVNWLGTTITKARNIIPGQPGAGCKMTIDQNEAFDFTGVNAILGPAGYVGYFPWTEVQPITTVQLQPSGNIYTSCRFVVPSFGAKVIYPDFVQAYNFVLVNPAYNGPVKAPNIVNRKSPAAEIKQSRTNNN